MPNRQNLREYFPEIMDKADRTEIGHGLGTVYFRD